MAGSNTWTVIASNGLDSIIGTGPTLPVNISSSTTYFASIVGSCASGLLSDSIEITVSACYDLDLTGIQASCLGNDATITCAPDTLLPLWDIELLDMNGASVQSALNLTGSSYTFTNLFPGTYIVNVASGISNSQDTIVVGQIQNPCKRNDINFSTKVWRKCNWKAFWY